MPWSRDLCPTYLASILKPTMTVFFCVQTGSTVETVQGVTVERALDLIREKTAERVKSGAQGASCHVRNACPANVLQLEMILMSLSVIFWPFVVVAVLFVFMSFLWGLWVEV